MAGDPFLGMKGIRKRYGGTVALSDVDFSLEKGEVHAVVGENGAGKSTLMNVMSGSIQPDAGSIFLDGKPVSLDAPHRANALGVRAVHQEFSLIPHLSVAENVLLGRLPTNGNRGVSIDWKAVASRSRTVLDDLGFPLIDERTEVSRLSVSQQQVVEIAKALAEKPHVLILDEPSAVLSKDELSLLFSLIRRLKAEGASIVYISHRLEEVFEIADRITVLRDGALVGVVRSAEVDQDRLIGMMVGRSVAEIYPRRKPKIGEEALSVVGLGREKEFENVTFSVRRGEIVGMFGLVGSGRTAVARSIFGAEIATEGTVRVAGKVRRIRTPRDAVRAGVSLVTEDRKKDGLVMSCSIRDNVSLASFRSMSHGVFLDKRRQETMVRSKTRELAIRPPQIGRTVSTLSGGNQQKVVLAKWLLSNPGTLLLDEPTRGVDIGAKVEIYHLMDDLASSGVGILLISSELPEILGMSDRILVMREGRIIAELGRDEASEEKLLQYAAGTGRSDADAASEGVS